MNSSTGERPYRSTGQPEFDVGSLRAKVDSYRLERTACVRDGERVHDARLLVHATVLYPERFQATSLEVELLRSDQPALVDTFDPSHVGVGIFKFYADFKASDMAEQLKHGFFSLTSAFKAASFEDAVSMLRSAKALESVELNCHVAGLHADCEWNLAGVLCATEISLALGVSRRDA
ncbi:MAG: hypothetical protein WD886_01395 [Burkholderiales bacterium]